MGSGSKSWASGLSYIRSDFLATPHKYLMNDYILVEELLTEFIVTIGAKGGGVVTALYAAALFL